MILNNQISQNVEIEGESSVRTASIDNRKLAKLQYILTTGLYKDGISAVMVELCNNGMDSVIESGKDPIENPVVVKLYKDDRGRYQLSIEDKGIGMSSDFFENRFMNLLDSTKEDSNDQIGHFGIGGKSWSSLNRSVTFTIRKDGLESKYLCYKGEEFIDFDPIYKDKEIDAEISNGVLFEMQIQDWSEYNTFCTKAKQKLAYYDTVVLFINGQIWENKIFRNELFQWSSNPPSTNLHLCLKDVLYTIDYEKLGISPIKVPIALRFGLESGLTPTPSREDILFNKESIALIKERIDKVADFFKEKYNETVKEFETFIEAYPYIDTCNYVVILEEKTFNIADFEGYGSVRFQEPKVKGISLRSPKYYKDKVGEFVEDEYTTIAHENYRNSWKVKHVSYEGKYAFKNFINGKKYGSRDKVVLFNDTLIGNIKEYLRQKHGSGTVYMKKCLDRRLDGGSYYAGYRSLLLLDKKDKSKWRELIKEWQFVQGQTIKEFFIDETDVESSQEYSTWLEDKKAKQKANREKGIYKGKVLNKQLGDITISFSRLSALDSKSIVFEKKAVPLSDLYKNKYITLYWEDTPENKLQAGKYHHLTTNFKLKIALIGKRELTKLPKLHNFMQEAEYQKTKQFRKFCTAIKAKQVISIFDSIYNGHVDTIKNLIGKYYEDITRLKEYVETNYNKYVDSTLQASMLHLAEEHNLFDLEEMVIVNRVKMDVERFDFIPLLRMPNNWDEDHKKKYSRIINQMLLFRKLYHKQFPDFEIVEATPVEVLQAMYVVDEEGELDCPTCELTDELEEVA